MNLVIEVPDSQDTEDQYFAPAWETIFTGSCLVPGGTSSTYQKRAGGPGSTSHCHQMDTHATPNQQNGSFGADSIMQDVAMTDRNVPEIGDTRIGDTNMTDRTAAMGDQSHMERPIDTANPDEESFSDSLDDIVLDIVYTYKRSWPLDRDIFLAPHELPHSRPGETRVPPCTVRYRLPIGINTNNDMVVANLQKSGTC